MQVYLIRKPRASCENVEVHHSRGITKSTVCPFKFETYCAFNTTGSTKPRNCEIYRSTRGIKTKVARRG